MKKFKLGFVPTRRFCFSEEDAHKYKNMIQEKLQQWDIDFIGIDGITEEGLLIHRTDAHKTAKFMKEQEVDAVFFPHCNFGTEEVVAQVAKEIGKPVLIWGPRDENPLESGIRLRDSQCGLFATSNVLQKFGVPFTYIVSSRVDSIVFERGFKNFIGAASAAKNFLGAKIGQISTRPTNFYTVIINEQELLSKWGIETVPITQLQVVNGANELLLDKALIKNETEAILSKLDIQKCNIDLTSVEKIAALKIYIHNWAIENDLSAIAIRCHEDIPATMGVYTCFVNAELTDAGIPMVCETDIHGALSSLLIEGAGMGEKSSFFADLTNRHPDNDNAELLWHCGNFPYSLCADPNSAYLSGHCNIPPHKPGTVNYEIKGGDITVARFDGMNGEYSLLMGEGKSVQGPWNQGTYTWMEVENWPLWEERIIYGPYIHHVAGINGKYSAALYEATKYIPGLKADPVQPTEDQIRRYLRGEI